MELPKSKWGCYYWKNGTESWVAKGSKPTTTTKQMGAAPFLSPLHCFACFLLFCMYFPLFFFPLSFLPFLPFPYPLKFIWYCGWNFCRCFCFFLVILISKLYHLNNWSLWAIGGSGVGKCPHCLIFEDMFLNLSFLKPATPPTAYCYAYNLIVITEFL